MGGPCSRRLLALHLILLCLALARPLRAEEPMWTSLGPGGGPRQFHLMTVDPQDGRVLYAGGQEGLYKSQDRGDTWQRVFGRGEPVWSWGYYNGGARVLVVDPGNSQVVFFGGEQGVYRSADGGQHWQQVSTVDARALAIDSPGFSVTGLDVIGPPIKDHTIYLGGDHRLYRSLDQGETWQLARDNLDVYALAIDPQDSRVVYAGCSEGLHRSRDRGLTWERLHQYSFSQLVIDPQNPQVLYGLRDNSSVFRSSDGGTTWNRSGNNPASAIYHTLLIDPQTPSTLYVSTLFGVYRSTDSGATWSKILGEQEGSIDHGATALDPQHPQTVYVGIEHIRDFMSNGGRGDRIETHFYRSQDRGDTWEEPRLRIQAFSLAQDAQDPQTLYLSTDNGVYRSGDTGRNWVQTDATQILPELIADPEVPGRLYGGGAGLFLSEDGGQTWTGVPLIENLQITNLIADPQPPAVLYALAEGIVYRSVDRGRTWIEHSSDLPRGEVRNLALGPAETLYAGAATGVYRSVDRGENWDSVSQPFPVDVLAVAAQAPHAVYAYSRPANALHRTEDGGETWAIIDSPPGNPNRYRSMDAPFTSDTADLAIDLQNPQGIFASTQLDGLYRSADGGNTWEFFNPGLPLFRYLGSSPYAMRPSHFFQLPSAPDLLYLTTDWGLCRIELTATPEPEKPDTLATSLSAWTSTGPSALLYGGFNLGFAVSTLGVDPQDPHVLYAGTASGEVFRRAADGHWSPASSGLRAAILTLAIDPQNSQRLYAGLEGTPAIYQTQDGGRNWWPATGNSLFGSVFTVAFDPRNSQFIYGGMNTNLVKTTNGGASWEKQLTLSEFAQFSAIAVDPRTPQTVYAGVRDPKTAYGYGQPGAWSQVAGVYKSTDGAKNWRRVMEGRVLAVQVDPLNPQIVYALVGQTGQTSPQVYQSVDGGAGWQMLDTSPIRGTITALMLDPKKGTLYVAADNRIFTSNDRGKTWVDVAAGLPDTPVYTLATDAQGRGLAYAATGYGMFSNEGLTNPALDTAQFPPSADEADPSPVIWTQAGLSDPIHDLVFAPSNPGIVYAFAGVRADSVFCCPQDEYPAGDVFRRDPDGRWTQMSWGRAFGFLLVDPHDEDILYTNALKVSEDGGRNWSLISPPVPGVHGYAAALAPRDPLRLHVGRRNYLQRSADRGRTWEFTNRIGRYLSLAIDPYNSQIVYAASVEGVDGQGDLAKSEDGGETWRTIAFGLGGTLAVDWQNPQQVYALIDSALYYSDDRGERWSPLPLGLEHQPLTALALDWQHSGTLYVAGRGQVFKSADYGGRWEKLGTQLPDTEVHVLAVDPLHPQIVYAGTTKGLYTSRAMITTVADTAGGASPADTTAGDTTHSNEDPEPPELPTPPTATALGRSFPNPFTLQTTIPYQLAANSVVRLEIFDLQGHRVRVLSEGLQPPGFYQSIWNRRDDQGQKLASGVYLIKFQAGSYSALRKVLLVK